MIRSILAALLSAALLIPAVGHAQATADEGVGLYRAGDYAGAEAAFARLLGRAGALPRAVRIRAPVYDALAHAAVGDSIGAVREAALALAEEPCLNLSGVTDRTLAAAFERVRPGAPWCGVRPWEAALVGVVVPGLPQFLMGRSRAALLEGLPSLGGVIAGALVYAASDRTYQDYRAATSVQAATKLYSSARTQREVATGLLAAGGIAWLLNVLHARGLAAGRAAEVRSARHFSIEPSPAGSGLAFGVRAEIPIGGGR